MLQVAGKVALEPRPAEPARRVDRLFLSVSARLRRVVPPELNPLAQTGAVANAMLVVAIVSGVLLLLWYSASMHTAYSSLEAMRDAPLTAQLVRSLHRYSSDACMLFVVLHALQLFFAGRSSGARWLAWVTGVVLVGALWVDGWLGYWLAWDDRAVHIAMGSARMADVLPIFPEPLTRLFLTGDSTSSLLFFVIFFAHMLIPAAMAVALLVHILRLSRPRFLPSRAMWGCLLTALVAASLVHPATSGSAASLTRSTGAMEIDVFYMLPLVITDRLGGGLLWTLFLGVAVLTTAVPWMFPGRREAAAAVDEDKCNGCARCAADCPFNAITMMPRGQGKKDLSVVSPDRCVSCGICVGACNSSAISLERPQVREVRGRLDAATGKRVAFVCGQLRDDPLPGWHVERVPCIGWVHPHMIERALRHGAPEVLLVGCAQEEPCHRLGADWLEQRLDGSREPALRRDRVDASRIRYVRVGRGELLEGVIRDVPEKPASESSLAQRPLAWAVLFMAVATALTVLLAAVPYRPPGLDGSELVVSFKAAGSPLGQGTESSAGNLPHMRDPRGNASRQRCPVRLRVSVDGQVVLQQSWPPHGLFGDGSSVGIARLPVTPGEHSVTVDIGDTAAANEWSHSIGRKVTFVDQQRRVLLYDRVNGFAWH